jgi:flagellin-specific chaperone FliS
MNPYNAYHQHKQRTMTRIDLIITLYRKGLDRLERAEGFLAAERPDAAVPLLAEAQMIVASMASGMAGNTDESALRFFRLYEFVCHKIAQGGLENVRAARKVLAPLLEAFETVREQAATMEAQGLIPPLDRDNQVLMTV